MILLKCQCQLAGLESLGQPLPSSLTRPCACTLRNNTQHQAPPNIISRQIAGLLQRYTILLPMKFKCGQGATSIAGNRTESADDGELGCAVTSAHQSVHQNHQNIRPGAVGH